MIEAIEIAIDKLDRKGLSPKEIADVLNIAEKDVIGLVGKSSAKTRRSAPKSKAMTPKAFFAQRKDGKTFEQIIKDQLERAVEANNKRREELGFPPVAWTWSRDVRLPMATISQALGYTKSGETPDWERLTVAFAEIGVYLGMRMCNTRNGYRTMQILSTKASDKTATVENILGL